MANTTSQKANSRCAVAGLSQADTRRLVRSIASRATWLERRREPDPLIRAAARREAEHCRRIAALLLAALVEASR
ncbi:hypothetical protein [Acidocella facilis]|uniref:hypothetical protein n=1 Tax=Acidocella facilis TaxID=525 RepID=UPI001F3C0218|nr:hypothetical protein [Acidocella facilis]